MLEKHIENYLRKQIKGLGGQCLKMSPAYDNGVPDRLVVLNGRHVFVELKAPNQKPRKLQVKFMEQLEASGAECVVLDSKLAVDNFVKKLTTC